MLDISVAYNRYKFIGFEFLTWLWYTIENDPKVFDSILPDAATLNIGNHLVLENRNNNIEERIIIKGDEADLKEGILSLKKGSLVTEMNLVLSTKELSWRFTLKGESFHITGIKIPDTGNFEKKEDLEGLVLERVFLYQNIYTVIDNLFTIFIKLRLSSQWRPKTVDAVKKWINT